MTVLASIFWDFNLPNSTTWFYFSFLLGVALFFKFARGWSMRNWDVVTIFLLVPGFLVIQEAKQRQKKEAVQAASLVGQTASQAFLPPSTGLTGVVVLQGHHTSWTSTRFLGLGYLILLLGSGYLFVRCLIDLVLVQRPALSPNLSFGGLAWLAAALFICLSAVAFRPDRTGLAPAVAPAPSDPIPLGSGEVLDEEFLIKRTFAILCHLAVVSGLIVIGYVHFQDVAAGMAAATLYLMLPYTGLYVGQAHHIWPVALVVWALAAYRWPVTAGILLGLAAGTAYFPALLLPLWLSFFWGRGVGRFAVAVLATGALCAVATGILLLASDDLAAPVREALSWPAWEPWLKPGPEIEGFWTDKHPGYRIPVFVAFLAFVLVTCSWPYPKNLAHVMALSAAVLIGIQFWYADHGGVYVLWYLPFLVLLVFRPNLSDRRPPVINADTDWLTRLSRALGRFAGRRLKPHEPVANLSK